MLTTFTHAIHKLKKLAEKPFRELSQSEVTESILAISDVMGLEESTRHQLPGTSQYVIKATNPWFNNRDFEKRVCLEYRKIFDENIELKEVLKRLRQGLESQQENDVNAHFKNKCDNLFFKTA